MFHTCLNFVSNLQFRHCYWFATFKNHLGCWWKAPTTTATAFTTACMYSILIHSEKKTATNTITTFTAAAASEFFLFFKVAYTCTIAGTANKLVVIGMKTLSTRAATLVTIPQFFIINEITITLTFQGIVIVNLLKFKKRHSHIN